MQDVSVTINDVNKTDQNTTDEQMPLLPMVNDHSRKSHKKKHKEKHKHKKHHREHKNQDQLYQEHNNQDQIETPIAEPVSFAIEDIKNQRLELRVPKLIVRKVKVQEGKDEVETMEVYSPDKNKQFSQVICSEDYKDDAAEIIATVEPKKKPVKRTRSRGSRGSSVSSLESMNKSKKRKKKSRLESSSEGEMEQGLWLLFNTFSSTL